MKPAKPTQKGKEELKSMADALESSPKSSERGNVDQIRDILFGAQMEAYEEKFAFLEERLIKESTNLREEILRQFQTLEQHVLREIQSLRDSLLAERDDRKKLAEDLLSRNKETENNLQKKIGAIISHSAQDREEFLEQINQQSKMLTDSIQREKEGLERLLQEQIIELREGKADRLLLASKLTELAAELNHEGKTQPPKSRKK
jgi:hypothetical protein